MTAITIPGRCPQCECPTHSVAKCPHCGCTRDAWQRLATPGRRLDDYQRRPDADIDDAEITDTAGNPILTTEPGMRITVDLPRTQAAKLGLRLIWRAITGGSPC